MDHFDNFDLACSKARIHKVEQGERAVVVEDPEGGYRVWYGMDPMPEEKVVYSV